MKDLNDWVRRQPDRKTLQQPDRKTLQNDVSGDSFNSNTAFKQARGGGVFDKLSILRPCFYISQRVFFLTMNMLIYVLFRIL